jgi:Plavaka transposase
MYIFIYKHSRELLQLHVRIHQKVRMLKTLLLLRTLVIVFTRYMKVIIHHRYLISRLSSPSMSTFPTTSIGFVHCQCCNKPFKRLSTHISQNEVCGAHYKTIPVQVGHNVTNVERSDYSYFNNESATSVAVAQGRRRKYACNPTGEEGRVVGDAPSLDNDDVDFQVFDDDTLPCSKEIDSDGSDEYAADGIILELYEEMQHLRSNPLGLDRFSCEEKVHIELLNVLKELKAPMKAFSCVLNWAAKANDQGHVFQVGCQPSRRKVIDKLYCRYNMKGLIPKEKSLYLPYSRRIVPMIYFDAREVFASLLSCPLLNRDENYLFDSPAKDPFVGPPTSSTTIGDINTGRCYRKTYEALVKKQGVDMILPSIMAMDKTQVDTYGRLQMEPLTMSHGLLKHSIRSKHMAMRILGYICHSPAHQPNFKGGVVRVSEPPTDLPPGTVVGRVPLKPIPNVSWSTYLLNEMHLQIEFILEQSGFLDLQRNGFHWKLHYNEKVYPVVMHPYIPFIIGDTEGHDRLCGHYTARFSAIKQLCRACECPTHLSGYSKAKFRHRKPAVINRLVRHGDLHALKDMSQNYLCNGFNKVRFGLHNDRGIFGACPGEMLHLVSLGWFKYCLEAFASQAGGKECLALRRYDRLCASIGTQLSRSSDRDLPRTNFPRGFSSGTNLMGHEITGCLLVKLFALHTTRFRRIFPPKKLPRYAKPAKPAKSKSKDKGNTKGIAATKRDRERNLCFESHVTDWILAVSSLLQWHQWMKQSTIPRHQVAKSQHAVQWLMRHVADVCPRPKGMGNNTIKTHLVLHLCEDILDHGVPENVNSAYAESAHIPLSKLTARNTQKRAKTFTKQAAERYVENLAISSAHHDMEMDIAVPPGLITAPPQRGKLWGRRFTISLHVGDERPLFQWLRPSPADKLGRDSLQQTAMEYLAKHCLPHTVDGKLQCCTEFISSVGQRYRAHPSIYDARPWNDHAMVVWPKENYKYPLPAFIHTFVDLRRSLQPHARFTIPEVGQDPIKAGVYALVHSFVAIDEEETRKPSNAMIGRYKLYHSDHGNRSPTLYLIKVDNIAGPTIGIRDIDPRIQVQEEYYLFLFLRKEEWASSWDSMITSCHADRYEAAREPEYEERVRVEGNSSDADNDDEEDDDDAAENDSNIEEDVEEEDNDIVDKDIEEVTPPRKKRRR